MIRFLGNWLKILGGVSHFLNKALFLKILTKSAKIVIFLQKLTFLHFLVKIFKNKA